MQQQGLLFLLEKEALCTIETFDVIIDMTKSEVRTLVNNHVQRVAAIMSIPHPVPLRPVGFPLGNGEPLRNPAPKVGKDKEEEEEEQQQQEEEKVDDGVIIIPSYESEEEEQVEMSSSSSDYVSSSSSSLSPVVTRRSVSTRKRSRPAKFDPDEYEDRVRATDVEDLNYEPPSADLVDSYRLFSRAYYTAGAFPRDDQWFRERYGTKIVAIVRHPNTGTDAPFDCLIGAAAATIDPSLPVPCLEHKKLPGPLNKTCYLCNQTKRCNATLWLPRAGHELVPWPIGLHCARLAHALIAFFVHIARVARECPAGETDWPKEFQRTERLFTDVLEAHAEK